MRTLAIIITTVVGLMCVLFPASAADEVVLFEDAFKGKRSDRWQVVGLKNEDYRLRDGGLEMRVQPGKLSARSPMLRVMIPFTAADTLIASVRVTVLDAFTREGECAGVYLVDEAGPEFGARKERVSGKMVFAPGTPRFIGPVGQEDDPTLYTMDYTPVSKEAGPLRVIVDRGYAFFQVGPSESGKYRNFFHSAIRKNSQQRGFALVAIGAPDDAAHWVRFEEFRVVRR